MLFSSLTFLLLFLPVTVFLYCLCPGKGKNIVLLCASLLFYAWGEPVYILLMLLSIFANYCFGRIIGSSERKGFHLAVSVFWNLAALAFFKYFSLFQTTFGIFPGISVALPIGISFYTFQAISYLADIRRGDIRPQKSLLKFAVYISMFPQLIAGPIVRYQDIEDGLESRKLTWKAAGYGSDRFIIGLSKKVLLANAFGAACEKIAALPAESHTVLLAWISALAYTFQIYYDFSGYSDMAIGLGEIFGFHFPENFNYPYLSRSITEFWRRWHISLGTWFREYVYIPLGGSRCAAWRHILNMLIVWMLTGLWHGASWNFLFWGLYYGILLIFDKYFFQKILSRHGGIGWFLTFFCTVLGWVIFSNTSFSGILASFSSLFGISGHGFADASAFYYAKSLLLLFAAGFLGAFPIMKQADCAVKKRFPRLFVTIRCLLLLLSVAVLVYATYNPFLYFRF